MMSAWRTLFLTCFCACASCCCCATRTHHTDSSGGAEFCSSFLIPWDCCFFFFCCLWLLLLLLLSTTETLVLSFIKSHTLWVSSVIPNGELILSSIYTSASTNTQPLTSYPTHTTQHDNNQQCSALTMSTKPLDRCSTPMRPISRGG